MASKNRNIIVTGASRGIGAAVAVGMAERGYDVVLNDIESQRDTLEKVAKTIEDKGQKAIIAIADVRNKAEVDKVATDAVKAFGHITSICNNAGILIPGEVDGLPEEAWDAVMDVNAKGSWLMIQAVLPYMKKAEYGRIVNIASIGGKHGAPTQAHYSASKAAVMGFTRVLAMEVSSLGITANCVCPGIIMTEMGKVNLDDPNMREEWRLKTAMRRLGDPVDVVGPVAFFCSDDSGFVTGQTLNVDGGINYT